MPIREVQYSQCCDITFQTKEYFLVFFSSRLPESNLLWCPDCRDVEDLIQNTFSSEEGPSAVLVYVGQRAEWKDPANIFRKEPWKVGAVPTVIKVDEAGKEIGRLVDGHNSISEELLSFIQ